MQYRSTSEIRRQRCQRRAVLAAMIVATSVPALAADQSAGGLRIVSPLPFSAPATSTGVHENPFCENVLAPLVNPSVQLASDRQESAIRMKPIGVAIGLRSIGDPDAPAPSEILITPPAGSAIQSNPLIGSAHHDHQQLDEVAVSETTNFDSSVDVIAGELVLMSEDIVNDEVAAMDETLTEGKCDGEKVVVTESLSFSISDAVTITAKDVTADDNDETLGRDIDPLYLGSELEEFPDPRPVVGLADPLVAIDFTQGPAISLKQLPRPGNGNWIEPPHANSTATPHDLGVVSASQRFRPPVAVSSPPLSIARNESMEGITLVRPTVTRVETFHLSAEATIPESTATTKSSMLNSVQTVSAAIDLHMTKTQVRTLTIGGNFRRVSVADQAVCQAITAGTSELKLIGTGRGITNLTVWADSGDGREPKMRIFRVHVEDAVDKTGEAVGDKTETLNQSIARAFPKCRVRVRQANGQLVVAGNCDSNESAANVLRMVRKTCLIPVVDELQIR